jgi:hypothetical protein
LFFTPKGQQAQYPDMGIPESSPSDQDGTWQSQSERVLCHLQKTRVWPILLRGGQCYGKGEPGHVGKMVNATTRTWGMGLHLPTRWGPHHIGMRWSVY